MPFPLSGKVADGRDELPFPQGDDRSEIGQAVTVFTGCLVEQVAEGIHFGESIFFIRTEELKQFLVRNYSVIDVFFFHEFMLFV
ncbi:hypothetical protein [Phocaeicola vulgatus]|uniref:hypothetical protein n=1 Tax=Phocaeicola vulgatus TaxID=821 RepID=UPI00216AB7D4|nr:hypothetical protein [Phocaeicola vulgatus]